MSPGPAGVRLLELLERAALDGHTVLPVPIAGSVLSSAELRLENALREVGPAGSGMVSAPRPDLLGLRQFVEAEQAVAQAVRARAADGRLRLVAGPPGRGRDTLAAEVGGSTAAIADDAQYLDVETLAAFFANCADGETAVLAGDLDGLGSPGPGRGFADIAASGLLGVLPVPDDGDSRGAVLAELVAAVRGGTLPATADPTREVVTVAAATGAEAAHRAGQLVADSIPRALGIEPPQIQVLSPLRGGRCGTTALAELLGVRAAAAPAPMTVHAALERRWPAVVLVLPPESAGLLCRQFVYSAVSLPTHHLSIVNATGHALGAAVARRPRRPRRTLLASCLGN